MKLYTTKLEYVIEEKIKPKLKLIHELKIRGLKDKYIAEALGISPKEFADALESFDLLKDTYNDAMEILCAELTDIVVNRALGKDGRTDKEGNPLPPDEKLAFKLLEKFDNRFSSKTEVVQTVSIESIIKGISSRKQEALESNDEEGESFV